MINTVYQTIEVIALVKGSSRHSLFLAWYFLGLHIWLLFKLLIKPTAEAWQFESLQTICVGNPPVTMVTGGFPTQRTNNFERYFDDLCQYEKNSAHTSDK